MGKPWELRRKKLQVVLRESLPHLSNQRYRKGPFSLGACSRAAPCSIWNFALRAWVARWTAAAGHLFAATVAVTLRAGAAGDSLSTSLQKTAAGSFSLLHPPSTYFSCFCLFGDRENWHLFTEIPLGNVSYCNWISHISTSRTERKALYTVFLR